MHYDEANNAGHLGWRSCDVIIRVAPPSFSLTGDKAGPDQPIFNVTVPNRGYQVIYRTIYDKGGGRHTTSWNLIGSGNSGTVLTCTPPVWPKRFDGDANNKENTIELQASADPFYKGLDINHDLSKGFESITASAVVSHTIIVDNTTPSVPTIETLREQSGMYNVVNGVVYHNNDYDVWLWPKDNNATKYKIKFSEDATSIFFPTLEELESWEFTPEGYYSYKSEFPINGVFHIYVSAGNDLGNWSDYGHKSVNILTRTAFDNNLLDVPVVTGPNVSSDSLYITWSWQPVASAISYSISVRNSKLNNGAWYNKTTNYSATQFTYRYNSGTYVEPEGFVEPELANTSNSESDIVSVASKDEEKRAELNLDNVEPDGHYNGASFSIRVTPRDLWRNFGTAGEHTTIIDLDDDD